MKKRYKYPLYNVAKLSDISATHSLRCDAKQFEDRFKEIRQLSNREGVFYLGELLPEPLIKGSQPTYIDGTDGIPVINTLSIQKLKIKLHRGYCVNLVLATRMAGIKEKNAMLCE